MAVKPCVLRDAVLEAPKVHSRVAGGGTPRTAAAGADDLHRGMRLGPSPPAPQCAARRPLNVVTANGGRESATACPRAPLSPRICPSLPTLYVAEAGQAHAEAQRPSRPAPMQACGGVRRALPCCSKVAESDDGKARARRAITRVSLRCLALPRTGRAQPRLGELAKRLGCRGVLGGRPPRHARRVCAARRHRREL